MIYNMPAREFSSGSEVQAAGVEVRRRLLGLRPLPANPLLLEAPISAAPAQPVEEAPEVGYAPLDMLLPPSWKFLVALTSVRHGVTSAEILGQSRFKRIAQARHDAVALVYSHGYRSLPQIGRIFGGRDHTTILHSIQIRGAKPLPPLARAREPEPVPVPVPVPAPVPVKRQPAPPKPRVARAPRNSVLQSAVARAYKNSVPLSCVAEAYGTSTQSLKVIAHRMGLSRSRKSKLDFASVGAAHL